MKKFTPIILMMSILWVGCENNAKKTDDSSELMRLLDQEVMLKLDALDEGALDEEYTDGLTIEGGFRIMSDTLQPHSGYRLRFGRQITDYQRDVSFDIQEDTAYADINQIISGNFIVAAMDSNHTVVDSFIKAFNSEYSRRVRFTRNDSTASRPWRIDAFTIGLGGAGNKVTITSLAYYDQTNGNSLYAYSANEAGNLFLSLNDVPSFEPGDIVRVEMTIENSVPVFELDSLDSGEQAFTHFGRGPGERARRRFNDGGYRGDTTAGDNVFTLIWRAHRLGQNHGNRRAFNMHFDVIDNATLFISDGGFNAAVWSIPYRIVLP